MEGASFGPVTAYSGHKGGKSNDGNDTQYLTADSTGNLGVILPPSDATISSSIDRPQTGANVADAGAGAEAAAPATERIQLDVATAATISTGGRHGDDNILDIPTDRARLWGGDVRVENRSVGVAAGKDTHCHIVSSALKSVVMPSGERRRGKTYGVRDTGLAGGLPRRGRLGGPSLGVIGVGSGVTSKE